MPVRFSAAGRRARCYWPSDGDDMAVQYAPVVSPPGEISMWPAELQSATLPRICVKTGQTAARRYTFNFVASDALVLAFLLGPILMPGVKARLPLAGWPATRLTGLVIVRALASGSAVFCLFAALRQPGAPWPLLLVAGVISGAVAYSSYLVYFFQAQFGEVHRLRNGERWVRLRGIHPNFVAGVERWRAVREAALRDPSLYSADLRWHWNGSQWVGTQPADTNENAARRLGWHIAWWQAAAGMLIIWAILGVLAWRQFHG